MYVDGQNANGIDHREYDRRDDGRRLRPGSTAYYDQSARSAWSLWHLPAAYFDPLHAWLYPHSAPAISWSDPDSVLAASPYRRACHHERAWSSRLVPAYWLPVETHRWAWRPHVAPARTLGRGRQEIE